MLKLAVSNALTCGELLNVKLKIDWPALAANCTYCEKLWLPLVTGNPRLDAVNSWSAPTLLCTVSWLYVSGEPHRKLM